ncbi:hypothetical protein [Mycoplasmopsis alligatoris]|nr:hypothetical protein [Mycoplasmopsis alligatoris]
MYMFKNYENFGLNSTYCSFTKKVFTEEELKKLRLEALRKMRNLDPDLKLEQLKMILNLKFGKPKHVFENNNKQIIIDTALNPNNIKNGYCYIAHRIMKVKNFRYLKAYFKFIVKKINFLEKITLPNCVVIMFTSKTYNNLGVLLDEDIHLSEQRNRHIEKYGINPAAFRFPGDRIEVHDKIIFDGKRIFYLYEAFSVNTIMKNLVEVMPFFMDFIDRSYAKNDFSLDQKHFWEIILEYFYEKQKINIIIYPPSKNSIVRWIVEYYNSDKFLAELLFEKMCRRLRNEHTLYWLVSAMYYKHIKDEIKKEDLLKFLRKDFSYKFVEEFNFLNKYKAAQLYYMLVKLTPIISKEER